MDGPDFGHDEVVDTFRFLVPVNRWFGGVQPGLSFFRRESQTWDRQRTYRILDAGCGIGDVAVALARWARRRGYRIQVDGVDWHPTVIELGRQNCRDYPEIYLCHGDVQELQGATYDYVHASQFIHHFPDGEFVPLLRHFLTLCKGRVVVNDLVRAPLAYLATWLFTLGATPVFRHDARLSVKRGFRMDEVRSLLREGGLHNYRLEWHFFFRFLLVLDQA
jgi:2-polyprenyl-3-methyl-5-hydroxy-6-metoxy-1,4-benzoquinol methylase